MQADPYIKRNARLLLIAVVLLLVIFWVVTAVSRIGEHSVSVTVLPADSSLFIDGKPAKAGTKYLGSGRHVFTAKRQDFKTVSETVTVKDNTPDISLLPVPGNDRAILWLNEHPDVQHQREALASQNLEKETQVVASQTSLVKLLPITSIEGPYSIDYGPSSSRQGGSVIVISDSTPNGRRAALKWIRQQGYDPTDLEIKYSGFVNPLTDSGALR